MAYAKASPFSGGSGGGGSSPVTTEGDIIVGNGAGDEARLAIGLNGKTLTSDGTTVSWETPVTGVTDHTLLSNIGTKTHATLDTEVGVNNAKISDINHVTTDLPNVDNTSDANKPVSTAQQTALDLKQDISSAFSNPMTTEGDILYGGASGAGTRLAKGEDGEILKLSSGVPSWGVVESSTINYISNGRAEDNDTIGWSTYLDAAGTTPVDGTGGTSTNLTFTSQATTVIRGNYTFKLAKAAANAQGEGLAVDFSIDKADQSKGIGISLPYNTDGSYVDGDIGVFIYDVTNTTIITPTTSSITGHDKDTSGSGMVAVNFQSTSSSSYRLIFHVTSVNALAYDLYLDDVNVGPEALVVGETVNEKITASYNRATAQSIPDKTATIIDYNTKVYDDGSGSDNVTTGAAWKFTAPRDGKYLVDAAVMFTSTTTWSTTDELILRIYKNGVYVHGEDQKIPYSNGQLIFAASSVHAVVELAATDYIDIRVYQASDAALNTYIDGIFNYVQVTEQTVSTTTVTTIPTSYVDPMTTRGDIIYRNASNTTAKLSVGAAGRVLQSDGVDVSWTAPETVESKTAAFTAVDKFIYLVSSAATRAITLPTASLGLKFVIKDSTGSCETNNFTVTRAGSESIDGVAANKILQTNWGSWTFVSDGTNWFIL